MDLLTGFGLLAVVFTVSALAAGLVERAPLSFPMIFLGLGLVLGNRGVLTFDLHDPVLEVVATLTLAFVLFLDAVNLDAGISRRDLLVPALALGPGTIAIILLIAGGAIVVLDFPWELALLLGAILASTDPVVLRDVLRDRRIPSSVRRALSVEAGTNDVVVLPVVLILIAVSNAEVGGAGGWASFAAKLFVLGPAAGFVVGAAGAWLMSKADKRFGIRREYQSLYGVGLVLGSYAAGVAVGGDGFLAAFAAGLAVTFLNQTLCDCFLEFGEAAPEQSMLDAFVLLVDVVAPALVDVALVGTLVLAVFAIVVARPLTLWALLSLRATRLSHGARAFIAWFGPRGLNSLLFALLVVAADVEGAELLFAVAGVVVLVSVFAHGTSATPLTAWYGRRVAEETLDEERESTATGLFRPTVVDHDTRIDVDELAQQLASDEPPIVLDVRTRSQFERDDVQIPGSVRVYPDEVVEWATDTSPEALVVLYCT